MMTTRKNFPSRINARRIKARDRLRASAPAPKWGIDRTVAWCAKKQAQLDVLAERITTT